MTSNGERVEYVNFRGVNGATTFELSGFMETVENPNGRTSVIVDMRSITDDGEYRDDHTMEGNLSVTDDGTVSGRLTSSTSNTVSDCNVEGVTLQDLLGEAPEALNSSCERRCADSMPDCPLNDEPADGDGTGDGSADDPGNGGDNDPDDGVDGGPVDGGGSDGSSDCADTVQAFVANFQEDGRDYRIAPFCDPRESRDLAFEILGEIKYPITIRVASTFPDACNGTFNCIRGPLNGIVFSFDQGEDLLVTRAVDCEDLDIGDYHTYYDFTLFDADGCEQRTRPEFLLCRSPIEGTAGLSCDEP